MQATTNEPATTEQLNGDPYSELDDDQAIEAGLQRKWKLLNQLERKLKLQEIQHQIERLQHKTTKPIIDPTAPTTTVTSVKLNI